MKTKKIKIEVDGVVRGFRVFVRDDDRIAWGYAQTENEADAVVDRYVDLFTTIKPDKKTRYRYFG